jgi:hypothetical protein
MLSFDPPLNVINCNQSNIWQAISQQPNPYWLTGWKSLQPQGFSDIG